MPSHPGNTIARSLRSDIPLTPANNFAISSLQSPVIPTIPPSINLEFNHKFLFLLYDPTFVLKQKPEDALIGALPRVFVEAISHTSDKSEEDIG